eukprot:1139967-Pelagomonas_calceolata.AAC.5
MSRRCTACASRTLIATSPPLDTGQQIGKSGISSTASCQQMSLPAHISSVAKLNQWYLRQVQARAKPQNRKCMLSLSKLFVRGFHSAACAMTGCGTEGPC